MAGTPRPGNEPLGDERGDRISTKVQRIATLAKQAPQMAFSTLAHHIDIDWLAEAFRRTRKDGAVGVDGQTAKDYAENLETNLRSLLDRAKSGRYRAPAVRRVHIPKGNGETRPIGIPTFEDKVLQRAVLMILEAIYEQDFLPCSFGFRPGLSTHDALRVIRDQTMAMGGCWLLEVDLRKYFDSVDRRQLQDILRLRVCDGVLTRLIGKWLNAGVLEDRKLTQPTAGTPQGGVISPMLANLYLHEVLDKWFFRDVQPRLKGRAFLVRYADDFVIGFEHEEDATMVRAVLEKRFAKYGLTIHPDKTRLLDFRKPIQRRNSDEDEPRSPDSFDFLGFTHYWGKTRRGSQVVWRKTASSSLSRGLRSISTWCRHHRHLPVRMQHAQLTAKIRGHYQYFGVTGNWRCLHGFVDAVERIWRKWLDRRSQKRHMPWPRFQRLLERYPLPPPRLYRSAFRAANP
jgi:RNA-directed DNA polymerase